MGQNSEIVSAFIDAFRQADLDRIMDFFEEDAVYHNIPLEPAQGTEAIRAVLQGFIAMASETDWIVHRIAEDADGVVMTERTDRFLVGETWVEIPVMGTFELRGGKLCAWRDYFDLAQFQKQLSQ